MDLPRANSHILPQTYSTLMSAILFLANHPGVQKKLHEELDAVVGRDRLPDFSDFDGLPYLHCVVEETLRFVAAFSVLLTPSLDV